MAFILYIAAKYFCLFFLIFFFFNVIFSRHQKITFKKKKTHETSALQQHEISWKKYDSQYHMQRNPIQFTMIKIKWNKCVKMNVNIKMYNCLFKIFYFSAVSLVLPENILFFEALPFSVAWNSTNVISDSYCKVKQKHGQGSSRNL